MRDPVSLPNSMSDPLDNRKVCRERRRSAAKNWLGKELAGWVPGLAGMSAIRAFTARRSKGWP